MKKQLPQCKASMTAFWYNPNVACKNVLDKMVGHRGVGVSVSCEKCGNTILFLWVGDKVHAINTGVDLISCHPFLLMSFTLCHYTRQELQFSKIHLNKWSFIFTSEHKVKQSCINIYYLISLNILIKNFTCKTTCELKDYLYNLQVHVLINGRQYKKVNTYNIKLK